MRFAVDGWTIWQQDARPLPRYQHHDLGLFRLKRTVICRGGGTPTRNWNTLAGAFTENTLRWCCAMTGLQSSRPYRSCSPAGAFDTLITAAEYFAPGKASDDLARFPDRRSGLISRAVMPGHAQTEGAPGEQRKRIAVNLTAVDRSIPRAVLGATPTICAGAAAAHDGCSNKAYHPGSFFIAGRSGYEFLRQRVRQMGLMR